MLNIPLNAVPDTLRTETDADKRWEIYQKFLAGFNLRPISLRVPEDHLSAYWDALGPAIVHIAGPSPRGHWNHGVIYRNGALWHDPHPERKGVINVAELELWVPIDPALQPRLQPRAR